MVKDYWNKLGLKERWGKRERFNYILNYIDKLASSSDNSESSNSDNPTGINNNTDSSSSSSSNTSGTGGNDTADNAGTAADEQTEDIIKTNISINVTDIDGNPISGAKVTVSNNDEEYTSNTGSAGGCTIRNVPLGDYTISTEKTGYIITEDDLIVTKDMDTVEIILDIEQAGL